MGALRTVGLWDRLALTDYVKQRYAEALDEVPRLPGETGLEARTRELTYLNLTRWENFLLDRKDRISMTVGLEVRVPFCDHRLVEYVFNAPWAMKNFDGREKSLLRAAMRGVLPDSVLDRTKSPYPSTQDVKYELALRERVAEILTENAPILHLLTEEGIRKLLDVPVGSYGTSGAKLCRSNGRGGRRLDDELEVMLMTTTPADPRGGATSPDAAHQATSITGVSGLSVEKFLDPMPIPPVITVPPHRELWELEITMRTECVTLHSQLPPTTVWTYNGSFPGPTIMLRRGQKLRVNWQNEITGNFPVTAVQVLSANPTNPLDTPGPGRGGVARPEVAALPPWTVVHLHGAQTGGGNDGWTENAMLPGNSQLAEYPNDQQATTLWYHDHAMAITALNVMSGLLGMYLIRDAEEDALGLPHGKHEVPLIICDRNFDTDADGNLTGELLHKVNFAPPPNPDNLVLPFLGPFTLVNGVIWPHLEVDARWVRFRVLNASNSRFYQFELRDEDDAPISGALHLIGTDGGLLCEPVALDQLTLAPAERADILINFEAFQGKRLTLVNTFFPPFEPGTTETNPDIMQFRVRPRPVQDPFGLPSTLSPSFVRLTHDTLPEHHHRWLVLTLLDDRHPEMWEMEELEEPPPCLPADGIVQVMLPGASEPTTLRRVGRTFKDAANFYIHQESWEQWRILNLSAVAHPIHLHLVQFQALSRELFDITGFDTEVGGTTTPVVHTGEGTLDPSEEGWKDTIRVSGQADDQGKAVVGELVSVIGQFGGASGRFMYHCHILEHEDEGMMSTFVVMPEEIMVIDPHMGGEPHHSTLRQTTLWDDRSGYIGPRSDAAPGPRG